ncbi:hypothetical protein P3S68_030346 [Capsicum galapagoense]
MMSYLDLSDNNIEGEIPGWIWSVGFISYLNLSCNLLESLEEPYNISTHSLRVLDLHSNRIKGDVPVLPTSLNSLLLPNNKFAGSIPSSICNLDELLFLDISNNSINNKIPSCLFQMVDYLGVFEHFGPRQQYLRGKVSKILRKMCIFGGFGYRQQQDQRYIPMHVEEINQFMCPDFEVEQVPWNLQCPIANQTWPRLQIVDISSNNFRGVLAPRYFLNWEGMMLSNNPKPRQYLNVELFGKYGIYYQVRMTLTLKGQEMEIVKILEVFTSIDFSCNNFLGEIPEVLGDVKSLYLLNFSHNALTGRIPKALGKLTQLGSLDLSVNQKWENSRRACRIPRGSQLQTFSAESFEGNTGLCGFPLNKTCSETKVNGSSPPGSHSEHEIDGKYISFALGSSVAFGIVTWVLFRSARYNEFVDRLLLRIFGQHKKVGRNRNRRR